MSAHNLNKELFQCEEAIDPGNAGTITADRSPHVVGLISTAAQTRTLARPTRSGGMCQIYMKTDGGDVTLTVTGGYNEAGSTTIVFSDPGQFATFVSCYESAGGTYFWRKTSDHLVGNAVSPVTGVASGYKVARGQHTTVAASDTVVTGLTTVVSAVASLESDPVVGASFASAAIGDQAGTPAAGSILVKTWKPTTAGAAGNPDVIAASTFGKLVNWIAIGT